MKKERSPADRDNRRAWSLLILGFVLIRASPSAGWLLGLVGLLLVPASLFHGVRAIRRGWGRESWNIVGASVLSSLLAGGILAMLVAVVVKRVGGPEAAKWLTPGSATGDAAAIVDEDYRFRLEWPGKGWKLVREAEIRQIDPDALAGAMTGAGASGVVYVEPTEETDLEAAARAFAEDVCDRSEAPAEVDLHGVRAMRIGGVVEVDGLSRRTRTTVLLNQGYLYAVHVGAPLLGGSAEEAFGQFEGAFRLLTGPVRPRARVPPVDLAGPGWCFRDGILEDAALGLRIEPPEGWRIAAGPEIAVTADYALDRDGTRVFLQRPRADYTPEPSGEPVSCTIGGSRLDLHSDGPGDFVGRAPWRGGALLVEVRGLLSQPEDRDAALRASLGGVRALTDGEVASLAESLAAEPGASQRVGAVYSLRGGTYRDFEHGFVWRSPAGYWRLLPHEEAGERWKGAQLGVRDRESWTWGILYAMDSEGKPVEFWHSVHVDEDIGEERSGDEAVITVEGGEVRVTWGPVRSVATAVRGGRRYRMILAHDPDGRAKAEPIVRALSFPDVLQPKVWSAACLREERMGFFFGPPGTGWRARDVTPASVRGLAAAYEWKSDAQEITILATCAGPDQAPQFILDIAEQQQREHLGTVLGEVPERSEGVLAGHPCRRLSGKRAHRTAECLLLQRGRFAYVLTVITDTTKLPRAPMEGIRSGFRLID